MRAVDDPSALRDEAVDVEVFMAVFVQERLTLLRLPFDERCNAQSLALRDRWSGLALRVGQQLVEPPTHRAYCEFTRDP